MCFGYARGRGGGRKRERKYIIFLVSYLLDEFGSFSVCVYVWGWVCLCVCVSVCLCFWQRERKREMFTNYSYGGGHSLYIFLSLWSMHVPSLSLWSPTNCSGKWNLHIRQIFLFWSTHPHTYVKKQSNFLSFNFKQICFKLVGFTSFQLFPL